MNVFHRWLCSSAYWRRTLARRVPWALKDIPLGARVLEIGPGFGLTTDLVQPIAAHLTCIELDPGLAQALRQRMQPNNVTVVNEDATSMSFSDASFDAVVCFTMLHHVPSLVLQDRLLAEAARVLRPGGVFVGTDSLYSWSFRLLHLCDTMVMVDPQIFPHRLRAAGFVDVEVSLGESAFRFRARKPYREQAADQKIPQSVKGKQCV